MTTANTLLAALARNPLEQVIRSSFLFEARAGQLDALTGDVATFTRAATATCVDSNGVTGTCIDGQERWESLDLVDSDGVTRKRSSLLLSTDDLTWAAAIAAATPAAQTWLIHAVERGTRTTSGAGLWFLGNDGATGARLWITGNATNYVLSHNNGTDATVTSTLATGTPATNAEFWLRAVLNTNGSVQLSLSLDGSTETTATVSSTPATNLGASWGAGTAKVRVNRVGSAGTQGSTALLRLQALPGVQTLATLVTTR